MFSTGAAAPEKVVFLGDTEAGDHIASVSYSSHAEVANSYRIYAYLFYVGGKSYEYLQWQSNIRQDLGSDRG